MLRQPRGQGLYVSTAFQRMKDDIAIKYVTYNVYIQLDEVFKHYCFCAKGSRQRRRPPWCAGFASPAMSYSCTNERGEPHFAILPYRNPGSHAVKAAP